MALITDQAEPPVNPIHNLLLAIAEVFDPNEADSYLEFRYRICQPDPENAEALQPVGLPRTCPPSDLPAAGTPAAAALQSAAGSFFPLFAGEEVRDDVFACLAEPFHSAAAGSPVLIRKTNKAVLLAIARSEGPALALQAPILTAAAPRVYADAAQVITKILSCFAAALPGPEGKIAKVGIELLSMALGLAGDRGPSCDQMLAMIRVVVREELVTNDLEWISARFAAIKGWINDTYLPAKRASQPDMARLRNHIDEQARPLLTDLNALLMKNHRNAGFPLLMIGVPIYLSLLQESLSLGVPQDLHTAGVTWAKNVLSAWADLKQYRLDNIVVKESHYASGCPPFMLIHYDYRWTDKVESCAAGPFKNEKACRRSASSHYDDVINRLKIDFADPDATAAGWQKL